jgi:site-specific recombinase
MSWLNRLRPKSELTQICAKYFGDDQRWKQHLGNPSILAQIVNSLRPWIWRRNKVVSLEPLLNLLRENEQFRLGFSSYLAALLKDKRFDKILVDADIIKDVSFFFELKNRIMAKLIPQQPDTDSIEYILTQVFYIKSDQVWLKTISEQEITELAQLVVIPIDHTEVEFLANHQLIYAAQVLVTRICGFAFESEVIKMVPEYENYSNPFLAFQNELNDFLARYKASEYSQYDPVDLKQIYIFHQQCLDYVELAYRNSRKYGISMRVNQYLLRIKQQLLRLDQIIQLLIIPDVNSLEKSVKLSKLLTSINQSRYNISDLFDLSTKRVAFEITQHKAKSGEHYITKSKSEYRHMLNASLGGGAIVGILCIVKVLLGKLDLSPFGMAVLYSMNYAIGFIVIYILGYTLATKQPAMTASSFIKTLEHGRKNDNKRMRYHAFAVLFSQLWRSQFIAFVGNVAMAFPVALIGIWVIDLLADYNIAASKSEKLLSDIHPLQSKALLHAAIAGIYLFLSGVIAGSISNSINHNRIPFRIKEHPLLKVVIGKEKTSKLAEFISVKYAGIASNFWFGVFMGTTGSVGYFVGLDLDIRHITFASGNMALGLYGADWDVTLNMILMVIVGIGLIGFINFGVSFTLSVIVAMRSMELPISELRFLFSSVIEYFTRYPLRFLFPMDYEEEYAILNSDQPKR